MIILCAVESKQVDKALPLCVRVFPSVSPSLVMSSLKQKQKNTTTQMGNCVEALIQDFTNNGLLCSSFNYIHPSSTISLVWITGESISAEMPRLFSPQPPPSALPCGNRVLGLHWGLQPPPSRKCPKHLGGAWEGS